MHSALRTSHGCISVEMQSRAKALDAFLAEQFGSLWRELRDAWNFPELANAEPKDLWAFFVVGVEIAQLALPGSRDLETVDRLMRYYIQCPPAVLALRSCCAGLNLKMVAKHRVVDSLIDAAWRAEIHGVSVSGLTPPQLGPDNLSRIEAAYFILRRVGGTSLELVEKNCSAIYMVGTEPKLSSGQTVSLTVKRIPGLIFLTEMPLLLAIESVVHEAAHLWLNGYERVVQMYSDQSTLVLTPLRRDPRPLSGLMHQTWVLLNLCKLYSDLSNIDVPELRPYRREQNRQFGKHKTDLQAAINGFGCARHALTESGRDFLKEMDSNARFLL